MPGDGVGPLCELAVGERCLCSGHRLCIGQAPDRLLDQRCDGELGGVLGIGVVPAAEDFVRLGFGKKWQVDDRGPWRTGHCFEHPSQLPRHPGDERPIEPIRVVHHDQLELFTGHDQNGKWVVAAL